MYPTVSALDRKVRVRVGVPGITIIPEFPLADVGWTGGIAHTPDGTIVTYLLTNKPGAYSSTVKISGMYGAAIDWGTLLLNFFNGSIFELNGLSGLISSKKK